MWIEIFGVLTGILYVILEVKQNRFLWPLGVLTSGVYIYVFFTGKFYADMGLQVYYVLISFYGWYHWTRGSTGKRRDLPVSRTKRSLLVPLTGVFMACWGGIWYLLHHFTDSPVPLGDSFTTALAIVATWMLSRKMIEHWYLWVLANLVSVALYIYKGLYPTTVLYLVYTAMAVYGYFEWHKFMHKDEQTNG
jgi:nicotinamide mononucleotide transporter